MLINLQSLGHFPEREGEKLKVGMKCQKKFVDVMVDILFSSVCHLLLWIEVLKSEGASL